MRAWEVLNESMAVTISDLRDLEFYAKETDIDDVIHGKIIDLFKMLSKAINRTKIDEKMTSAESDLIRGVLSFFASSGIHKNDELMISIKKIVASIKREAERVGLKRGAKTGYKKGVVGGRKQIEREKFEENKRLRRATQAMVKRFSRNLSRNDDYISQVLVLFDNKGLNSKKVEEFIMGAIRGDIINLAKMVKKPRGTVHKYVKPKYREVFNKVHKGFMGTLTDPSATRGNIGPGELLLVLFGSPVEKAEKGDLDIAGTLYEIKASSLKITQGKMLKSGKPGAQKRSPSGGRFTGSEMDKMKSMWPRIRKMISNTLKIPTKKFTTTSGSAIFNINGKGLDKFNEITEKLPYRRRKVLAFVRELTTMLLPSAPTHKNYKKIINSMVEKNGSLDSNMNGGNFMAGYLTLNLYEYQLSEHVDNIMFLNQDTLKYEIVKSAEELAGMLKSGKAKITSGIVFNDTQNEGAPQIYYGDF